MLRIKNISVCFETFFSTKYFIENKNEIININTLNFTEIINSKKQIMAK